MKNSIKTSTKRLAVIALVVTLVSVSHNAHALYVPQQRADNVSPIGNVVIVTAPAKGGKATCKVGPGHTVTVSSAKKVTCKFIRPGEMEVILDGAGTVVTTDTN